MLTLGVTGKLALWHALKQIDKREQALAAVDLLALQERAEHQLARLERSRRDIAAEALAD